jgi:uncharacterized protein YhhL (DUF1145 family)
MNAPKVALLVVWLLCGAGFFVSPDSTLATWARYGFWLMLAAHVVESAIFFPKFKQAPGSLMTHVLSTLVFGVLHIRDLPPAVKEESA